MKLSRTFRAKLAWCVSLFKSDFTFEDYPLDFVYQGKPQPHLPARQQFQPWRADLLGLPIAGLGNDKDAALEDAKIKFAKYKNSHVKMKRPGSQPKLEFASAEKVSRYPELRDDFIHRVLDLPWAFISDESSLWDFHMDEDNSQFLQKIKLVYGIDVSDVEGGVLWRILDQIDANRHPQQPS